MTYFCFISCFISSFNRAAFFFVPIFLTLITSFAYFPTFSLRFVHSSSTSTKFHHLRAWTKSVFLSVEIRFFELFHRQLLSRNTSCGFIIYTFPNTSLWSESSDTDGMLSTTKYSSVVYLYLVYHWFIEIIRLYYSIDTSSVYVSFYELKMNS